MASYRNISMDFWTDSKVVDDFYARGSVHLSLLHDQPHTNLAAVTRSASSKLPTRQGTTTIPWNAC